MMSRAEEKAVAKTLQEEIIDTVLCGGYVDCTIEDDATRESMLNHAFITLIYTAEAYRTGTFDELNKKLSYANGGKNI